MKKQIKQLRNSLVDLLTNGKFELLGLENDNSIILLVDDVHVRFRRDYKNKILLSENSYGCEKYDIDSSDFFPFDVILSHSESERVMYHLTTPQN